MFIWSIPHLKGCASAVFHGYICWIATAFCTVLCISSFECEYVEGILLVVTVLLNSFILY